MTFWRALVVATSMALLVLTCTLTLAMTAHGARQQKADVPDCAELLTLQQAEVAMDESRAAEIDREVKGNTRYCTYYGSPPSGEIEHSIEIGWGPYSDYRKRILASPYKALLCGASKDACRYLKQSVTPARSGEDSFRTVAKALSQVGEVALTYPEQFGKNPVIRWLPSAAARPIHGLAYVLVYIRKSDELLQTYCTEHPMKTPAPAMPCALAGARIVFNNMT